MNSSSLFLDIGPTSLKARREQRGAEWSVERDEAGRLTSGCREMLVTGLQGFLRSAAWRPRHGAWCCLGARGVSFRRLALPAARNEELQRLLLLQIESEFPLPPDQLAWGCVRLASTTTPQDGTPARTELLVVAVKKEVVQEYAELFAACGVEPEFTLAALARAGLCPSSPANFAILDLGPAQCELAVFEKSIPVSVRTLPGLGQNSNLSGLDHAAFDPLVAAIQNNWTGHKLYLSGPGPVVQIALQEIFHRLPGVTCLPLEMESGDGASTAIMGMKKSAGVTGGADPLVLHVSSAAPGGKAARPAPLSWAAMAAALMVCCLLLPSLEALLGKPPLQAKLASLNADRKRLPAIDQELGFLQSLQQNQPPYLDALSILAKHAPQGIRIEAVSMNRHGDLQIRGKLANAQQVGDFRSKLIDSGFFSTVVVEEQAPSPDRTVTMRLSAKWKPAAERASPTLSSLAAESTRKSDSAPAGQPAAPPKTPPATTTNSPSPAAAKN